jgi:hypothetical protein
MRHRKFCKCGLVREGAIRGSNRGLVLTCRLVASNVPVPPSSVCVQGKVATRPSIGGNRWPSRSRRPAEVVRNSFRVARHSSIESVIHGKKITR